MKKTIQDHKERIKADLTLIISLLGVLVVIMLISFLSLRQLTLENADLKQQLNETLEEASIESHLNSFQAGTEFWDASIKEGLNQGNLPYLNENGSIEYISLYYLCGGK